MKLHENEQWLEDFYQQHIDSVYKFFYFKSLHVQIAEDLTSDCFMKFAIKVHEHTPIADPETYLNGIAHHVWNDYLRDKYRLPVTSVESFDTIASFVEAEEGRWASTSLEDRALQYIDKLPSKQREVAYQKLILKYSNKEVMQRLEVSENYVKVTFRRAMRNLERAIEMGESGVES